MKRPTSLAGRLSRSLLSAIGALWLVLAAVGAGMAQYEVNEGMDNALVDTSYRLLDLALHDLNLTLPAGNGRARSQTLVQRGDNSFDDDHMSYQVVNAAREVLLRSSDAPAEALKVPLENGFTDLNTLRVYTYRHPDFPIFIHIADSLDHRREAMTDTLLTLLVPMLLMLPLLAWLIHTITRKGLAEVGVMADDIGERNGRNLSPLPDGPRPSELQVIADSTNRLLQRLGDALDTEKALAANAAHELRTPLATAQLRLHALLAMALTPAQELEARKALASLVDLNRRAEKLLQLSRAESGAALSGEPVNLAAVAATVVQDFWGDPALLDRVRLHVPSDDDIMVAGDFDTLAIVVRNLLENALRYGAGSTVDVIVEAPATIRVRDGGPGVASDQLAQIRQRHVTKQRHSTGYGLGMSIVGTVVERHRGQLVLLSPPPGQAQGFEAQVVLPATA